MPPFSAVKIFSTSLARDREVLGETITEWLRAHPELKPVAVEVAQSSDREYHCLTVTVFLQGDASKLLAENPTVRPSPVAPRPVVPRNRP